MIVILSGGPRDGLVVHNVPDRSRAIDIPYLSEPSGIVWKLNYKIKRNVGRYVNRKKMYRYPPCELVK